MGDVYRRASRVVAWLGPAENNSDKALDFLEYISSQIKFDWKTRTLSPPSGWSDFDARISNKDMEWNSDQLEPTTLIATRCLWEREWFYRVWIRQEIILAKAAILQVGHRKLKWQAFRSAIGCINCKPMSHGPKGPGFHSVYTVCEWFEARPYSLDTLRWDLHDAQCRDPRDRIYGIMSLLHHDARALNIQPNYLKLSVEVYRGVLLEWIARHRTLEFLTACELAGPEPVIIEGKRLPSWVPNWSILSSTSHRPPYLTHGTLVFQSDAYALGLPGQDSRDTLKVTGVQCATVSHVFEVEHQLRRDFLSNVRHVWYEIREILSGESLYPSEESLFDAFCRSLMYGRFAESCTNSSVFSEVSWPPIHKPSLKFTVFRNLISSVVANTANSALDTSLLEDMHIEHRGRTPLVLSNGAIGSGLRSAQQGDIVCWLLGSQLPTVLRPVNTRPGKHYVVGPCYVDGIMAGEPLLGHLPEGFQFKILLDKHRKVSLVEQPEGLKLEYFPRKDPRLERLDVDLKAYNRAVKKGKRWQGTVYQAPGDSQTKPPEYNRSKPETTADLALLF
ncbi:hypothetical protein F5Y03DRAFT_401787 [Xylaria venustula]|nr:hypothetical protein F5Y03DRAFT_401787 [Xylaria venustula]